MLHTFTDLDTMVAEQLAHVRRLQSCVVLAPLALLSRHKHWQIASALRTRVWLPHRNIVGSNISVVLE